VNYLAPTAVYPVAQAVGSLPRTKNRRRQGSQHREGGARKRTSPSAKANSKSGDPAKEAMILPCPAAGRTLGKLHP